MADRKSDERDIEISFYLGDLWGEFQKQMFGEITTMQEKLFERIDNQNKALEEKANIFQKKMLLKLDEMTSAFETLNQLKETYNEELINLNNVKGVLDNFKATNVVINNPTYEDIFNSFRKDLSDNFTNNQEIINMKLNKDITDFFNQISTQIFKGKIGNIESTAKKLEENIDIAMGTLKEFDLSMKKGKESLFESEMIVAKLLYALRFFEKLSPETREKIILMDETQTIKLKSFIESIKEESDTDSGTNQDNSRKKIFSLFNGNNKDSI